jgi:hypothetical protein
MWKVILENDLMSRSFAYSRIAYPSCRSSSFLGAAGKKLVILSSSSSSLSAFNISFLEKNFHQFHNHEYQALIYL